MSETEHRARVQRFRAAIQGFIDDRREAKLKGKQDPDVAAKYEYHTWLESAAKRVTQVHAVTHIGKATHPDAKGGSLLASPASLEQHAEVGSHCLPRDFALDVVGNAAALDVFKLLSIEVEGSSLLHWAKTGDADFISALHPDVATARVMNSAFRGLSDTELAVQTDPLAKQLYWLVGEHPTNDAEYHLIQPLFSSSLMHAVHTDIDEARYGATNKLARQAKRANKPFSDAYVEYRQLGVRQLGGSKPQNISMMTSVRHGTNYLLDASPPRWRRRAPVQLNSNRALWQAFLYFGQVRGLLRELTQFLLSDPPGNVRTRRRREGLVQAISAWLTPFAEYVGRTSRLNWTEADQCKLDMCFKLWLKPPAREGFDADRAAYDWGDWPDEVAGHFASWMNSQLRDAGLKGVGDVEYRYLAKQAILDTVWPVPLSRRAPKTKQGGLI